MLFQGPRRGNIKFPSGEHAVTVTVPADFSAKGAAVFKIYDKNPSYIPAVQLMGYLDSQGRHGKSGLSLTFDDRLYFDVTTSASVAANAAGGMLLGIEPERNDNSDHIRKRPCHHPRLQNPAGGRKRLSGIKKGAIAVTKTGSGEILALASVPSFSPRNLSAALKNPDSPFLNRSLCNYNLGSIFKICVVCAALESGIPADFSYCCTGSIDCGNTFFCHKSDGHGSIDMSEAFAKSCNTYFIALAKEVGADKIYGMAQKLGLSGRQKICGGLEQSCDLGELSKIKESSVGFG